MGPPVVSVLMTTCNGGRFLRASVEAVLAQEGPALELLLLDNGSTDGAVGALAAAITDPRLRIEREPENLGIVAGTNRTFARARGAFIAVVDHDDIVLPGRLARQVAWLEANPAHGGVASRAELIDADGARLGPEFTLHTAREHHDFTQFSQAACFGTHLFRREVVAALPRRAAFPLSSDYDFVARVSERWPVTALPEVWFQYRIHAGQATQRRRTAQIAAEGAIRVLAWRRRAGLPEDYEATVRALEFLAGLPDAAAIYRAMITYCRTHGMPRLAAYHARKLLGVSKAPADLARAATTAVAIAGVEGALALFLRGPLAAGGMRPWPAYA